ncbi:MAG: RDD family protein [Hyphomicrobiales bacterium]|nr:RDD family protein [Hyphomicrobiales bacterium]
MSMNDRSSARSFDAADYPLPDRALMGVRTRRMIALLLDLLYLSVAVFAIVLVLFILGIPTLGLSWFLIPGFLSLYPLIALAYNGLTISGWRRATPGMRHMDLEMRMTDASRVPFLNAAIHAVLYYLGVTFLTPLILLVSLVTINKRCLHDMLSGVVVTRRQD